MDRTDSIKQRWKWNNFIYSLTLTCTAFSSLRYSSHRLLTSGGYLWSFLAPFCFPLDVGFSCIIPLMYSICDFWGLLATPTNRMWRPSPELLPDFCWLSPWAVIVYISSWHPPVHCCDQVEVVHAQMILGTLVGCPTPDNKSKVVCKQVSKYKMMEPTSPLLPPIHTGRNFYTAEECPSLDNKSKVVWKMDANRGSIHKHINTNKPIKCHAI